MSEQKNAAFSWAVVDLATGESDGWYAQQADAERQFAFWKAERPTTLLTLVGVPRSDPKPALPKLASDEWFGKHAKVNT